jgi:hypothetical protein
MSLGVGLGSLGFRFGEKSSKFGLRAKENFDEIVVDSDVDASVVVDLKTTFRNFFGSNLRNLVLS